MNTHRAALMTLSALLGLAACDSTPAPNTARLAGASSLVFRCIEGEEESLKTYPLERCGCLNTSLSAEGERSLTPLTREECLSSNQDARLIGYLASETQGRVATLELGSARQVVDIDASIPGVTHIGVDGLISELGMHPYGDYLLLLRGPDGVLSTLTQHGEVSPERSFELNRGPLTSLALWPVPNEPLPEGGSPSYAYVYAPLEGELLELNLDALELASDQGAQEASITRQWSLSDEEGAPLQVSAVSVDPRGQHLVIAHANAPAISVLDLSAEGDEPALRVAYFAGLDGCQDPYLTQPEEGSCAPRLDWPEGERPACADGLDNDDDGLVDRADPGCERESDDDEAESPELSSVEGSCDDELDNDGDGLVDGEDPGCRDEDSVERYAFERTPQCSDGVDNDLDGLIDFDAGGAGDPECLFAADQSETRDQVELGSPHLLTATLSLPSGERSFAYVVSPRGSLLSVDLDTPELKVNVISPARSPLAVTLRRTGALASLFYVTADSILEQVHLTAPEALFTTAQTPVYALGTLSASQDSVAVEAFYTIIEHRAYELTALSPWAGDVPVDTRTLVPALPREAANRLAEVTLDELQAQPLNLDERRGEGDLQVFVERGRYPLYQAPWNRLRDAAGQHPRVTAAPNLSYKGVPALFNPERHPALCRLIGEEGELVEGPSGEGGACTLIGAREDGSSELSEEQALRLSSYLSGYEGALVRQASASEETPSLFSVSYEGLLPGSLSDSGALATSDADRWRMVDYEVDFCDLGVEVGDLLIAEPFTASSSALINDPECLSFLQRSPNEGLYPLRYRVQEVRQRGLTLTQDDRQSYEPQLGLNSATVPERLAPSLPPPPARCLAQTFSYRIHVGAEQWLVSNNLNGYQHPWRSEGGRCVERAPQTNSTARARARLGERYQGPWLTFQLGFQSEREGQRGVTEGALPMMIGARLDLAVNGGRVTQRLSSVGLLPMELKWLPELDRLYVVDAATQSAVEFDQIDPYTGFMRQVQLFE